MPNTFQALAVLLVALLPGALYVWSFERQAGRCGIGLSDRLLRFVGGSAIFQACVAPASYWLWSTQWPEIRTGEAPSWWLWLLAVIYVAAPLTAGTCIGHGTRQGAKWSTWFTDPDPAPRAWDHLFQQGSNGWVRVRLKSGAWIGGAFTTSPDGRPSYAAGYPEEQDLYLSATAVIDPDTGAFAYDSDGGVVQELEKGLLIRWDEVEYLQFIDA